MTSRFPGIVRSLWRRLLRRTRKVEGPDVILDLAPGWSVELDRGPGWLFVHVRRPATNDPAGIDLAERVWKLLEQEFGSRLVLELDEIGLLRSHLVGELVRLHKRITSRDGVMRVCGLSDNNYEVLRTSQLHQRFPRFRNREEAVMGYRPTKPR
jgi:hypothetical protein